MIILIGGNSCTGKTIMSQKLLERYKIPYFSIDHLKMGLYRSDGHCGFTPLDSNEVIAAKLWPIMKEMIKTMIENNQSRIIEGCYLLPKFVKDLEEQYPDKIISVYLGFSTNYIENNFKSSIIKYRNIIENRGCFEERPIKEFINEHNKFRQTCIDYGVQYHEINSDYEEEIKTVYELIDNRMAEVHLKK
ncbi:MAG: 2-phosphoglycerate kinase [Anaerobacillus sp.]|uniref:2-phosphoglycerate kinase n=1 Tax=Anaerobacillus sp. TaxID=1872506 RepID=UPI00391B073C